MPSTTALPLEALQRGPPVEHGVVEGDPLVAQHRGERPIAPLERGVDQIHRRAADEAADEDVQRVVVQLLRRRDLLQLALAHDGDAVAHRHRLDLIVRDVDRRHPERAREPADLGAHLDAKLRVEVRERLVHQEGLRLADDRAPHRDALPLAARECPWLLVEERFEAEDLRRLAHALADLLLLHLAQPEAERDVVEDGQVRVERVGLEDHRDVAVLRRHLVDDTVTDPNLALADLLEPGDHAQGRRLAAAGRADEHHELLVLGFEIEFGDGFCPVREDLRDIRECDGSHARGAVSLTKGRERPLTVCE